MPVSIVFSPVYDLEITVIGIKTKDPGGNVFELDRDIILAINVIIEVECSYDGILLGIFVVSSDNGRCSSAELALF